MREELLEEIPLCHSSGSLRAEDAFTKGQREGCPGFREGVLRDRATAALEPGWRGKCGHCLRHGGQRKRFQRLTEQPTVSPSQPAWLPTAQHGFCWAGDNGVGHTGPAGPQAVPHTLHPALHQLQEVHSERSGSVRGGGLQPPPDRAALRERGWSGSDRVSAPSQSGDRLREDSCQQV